jgi:hypothetical protein
LIALWRADGGWIAFTGNDAGAAQVEAAYAEAAKVRREV